MLQSYSTKIEAIHMVNDSDFLDTKQTQDEGWCVAELRAPFFQLPSP
jgi:hypothetical protein